MHTRHKNDIVQRQKQADILTHTNRYRLGMPGIDEPGYVPDLHIRPQLWAGNLRTDSMQIGNGLSGLGHNRTAVYGGTEMDQSVVNPVVHPLRFKKIVAMEVSETRLAAPAWSIAEKEHTHSRPPVQYPYRPFIVRPPTPAPSIQTRVEYIKQKEPEYWTIH